MKRPVPEGEFRSNVAQGSEPVAHELTPLEREECIKAAKSVDGLVTGVDFIPSPDPTHIWGQGACSGYRYSQ